MELNQKALEAARNLYKKQMCSAQDIVEEYIKACNEPEQARPFAPALVKPGDEVICKQMAIPRKFVGMTSSGLVVTETPAGGMVQVWEPSIVTIPHKPKKTVKVRLFRYPGGKPAVLLESDSDRCFENGWEPCSAIVEIEVTE